ncbi:MAG: Hsp70 family protein [Gammaproteobacteria bacterium]|nr:Hsp70 family protein [Gammaproteobacteria bacterium]
MVKNYLGIDLGTTESTVSVIEIETRRDQPMEKLRTLDIYQYNRHHQLDKNIKGLQSSIYIDRKNKVVYTGEYAKEQYSSGNMPLNTIRSIKTRIGGGSMIEVPLKNNGWISSIRSIFEKENLKSYNMTELSAILLKSIKNSVEKQCGSGFEQVTITIPSGFDSDERNATIAAGVMAGFKKVNLLDEPTAVLLNLLNSEDGLTEVSSGFFNKQKNIVVYDIGGGTLDISVASVEDNEGDFDVSIVGRSKRMEFGGDDIDKYIASYFLQEFEKINPSIDERSPEVQAKIVSRIVSHAQKHKVNFSKKIEKVLGNPRRRERVKESVNFEIIDDLKVSDLTLYDSLLRDILSPIISANGLLINPLDRVLKSCKLNVSDIDLVVLTGGSAKFYLVSEVLERYFQGIHVVDFTEYNAVSKGAAIHSFNQGNEDLKKIQIKDIMSDSIYIKRKKGFDELIPHNQALDSNGQYGFVFEDVLDRLELFLYYGSEGEDKWKYREIGGVFHPLDRGYEIGDEINLDWSFDENKILKIFYNGCELVSSSQVRKQSSELLDDFELKG